jgi:hypothetical protein
MRKTLKYSFSLLALLAVMGWIHGQDGMRVRGPRIGFDLASLRLLYFDPDRMLYTVSVDYEFRQDIYPVVDLGYQHVKLNRENYQYRSSGIFARVGTDVNLLNYDKQVDVYEMLYVGGRYGLSLFDQQADNIFIPDAYWGDFSGGKVEKQSVNAHWFSLGGGMRAEVFRNFFMGWSVFMNIRFFQSGAEGMVPYNIPGFGKGANRVTVSFNYSLSYRLPIQRYTPKIKAGKKKSRP